ncbi:MAG: phenylalanine--tRNA ligase subunit beta [Gammaproteobacteria bacterium]
MKFSEAWLREWANPDISTQELGERLTMAGLTLDGVTPVASTFSGVVVGRIVEAVQHPHAARLRVCQVDDGSGQHLPVVCGAPNAKAALRAPFARVGAVLTENKRIGKAKLRGVESQGMLCSAVELGLGEDADGLLELADDAPAGAGLRDYLQLDDTTLELDLTPNRADCLSIAGVAREVASFTGTALKPVIVPQVEAQIDDALNVELVDAQGCPRYAGRVIKGIDPNAITPLWMRERLRRCGVRAISPVVDVTNYVMLELGQPMHAFDLSALRGGIRVRMARSGEELELLDGQQLRLDEHTLVIADHERAVALAGIMGGAASAVSDQTRDIFLESAFFAPRQIAGKARQYGMHTDASHRFERGVDPALQRKAIERATALLIDIAGGSPGPVTDVADDNRVPTREPVGVRIPRIEAGLGVKVPEKEIARMFTALGCQVEEKGERWTVTPPSFRFDLAIEADFVEEVGRLYGYDKIPSTSRVHRPSIRRQSSQSGVVAGLRAALIERGYQEAITFSFIDEEANALFAPGQPPRALANPISSDLAVMRASLWPGLIKAVIYNLNRQQARVRLFETGLKFVETPQGLEQIPVLAGVASGAALPEQWGARQQNIDFYDIKGDVEDVLGASGLLATFSQASHSALHPGQSAAVEVGGKPLGWVGVLHPGVESTLGLEQPAFVFELALSSLELDNVMRFEPLSRFPAIRRDIAVVVDEAVSADQISTCIRGMAIPQLRGLNIFDIYRGKGVVEGRKSVALGLILQDLSRTLSDRDVEDLVAEVVAKIHKNLGGNLRN